MGFVSPDYGTIFWMVIIFGITVFILKKFAWTPLLNALKARENSISEALSSAEKARREMDNLKVENEKIIDLALREKDVILKDAGEIKSKIIAEARHLAETEGQRLITAFRLQMEVEKRNALDDMRKQVTELSILVAEKIIKKELEDQKSQEAIVENILKDMKLQ